MATDVLRLERLYRDLCQRSIDKDADGILELLAPEYALVHMTGVRQSGEEYVRAVLDGTLNYYRIEHDSIEVDVASDGKTATICARSRTLAAVYGGGQHTWQLQQDLRARKVGERWLLTESQASTY